MLFQFPVFVNYRLIKHGEFSFNIIRMENCKEKKRAGDVARMGINDKYRYIKQVNLKTWRKETTWETMLTYDDNTKMGFKELQYYFVGWFQIAQNTVKY